MPPADTRRVRPPSHLAVLRRDGLCLHVLSSFQRTGLLPGALPSLFRPRVRHAPLQLYFLRGNLAILESVHRTVNHFLATASIFLSRRPSTPTKQRPTVNGGPRAEVRLGSCELKEGRRVNAAGESVSVHSIYVPVPPLSTQADA
jgi:hypothetical protein